MFHYLRKYGMYVIRFFKNYKWCYVIIDDRLPAQKKGYEGMKLVFARCRAANELWVPIIEKAYAKIHNCYEALISGYIDDGLADMTGLVSEKVKLQKEFKKKGVKYVKFPHPNLNRSKDELWSWLREKIEQNTMMGCSINSSPKVPGEKAEHEFYYKGDKSGLMAGHAYSIIDIIDITDVSGKPQRILRLRNPWGKLLIHYH